MRTTGVTRFACSCRGFARSRRQEREPSDGANREDISGWDDRGVASDGIDLQTLYWAATQALSQAKEVGGNRVLPTGWCPNQAPAVRNADIVLVEDDETLAEILLHAFETRGYHHVWLQDGEEAVNSLAGSHPRLKTRVVLLDVDLPRLDGLAVLRRLAHDGLLQHTRVIMLTFRTDEREVIEALELGAFDHVTKPFSLPVLMQRIRRTLQL